MINIIEVLRLALSSLSSNILRSILTILAIVVGVFAVISASTAVAVIDSYFKNTMTLMGGSVINVSSQPMVRMGDGSTIRNRQPLRFWHYEDVRDRAVLAGTISPSSTFGWSKRVEFDDKTTNPTVRLYGSNEFWVTNNAYDIAEGRDLTHEDVVNSRPVVIIGEDVRKELFDQRSPVNQRIRIDGQWYSIVGLASAKGSAFGQSLDNFVMAPYTRLGAVYGFERSITMQVQAPSVLLINDTIDEITGILRVIREVEPSEPNDFEVATNESLRGTFDQFTGMLNIFGLVVGGIALLGAGIGVMNIMLVSVTERTREIGIRKSIGANRKAIIQQFLLETIVICQIGGLIGIIVGILGGNLLAVQMETAFVVPWAAVVTGVLGMTGIGLVFGVYPAIVAARLDPIVSLRYE